MRGLSFEIPNAYGKFLFDIMESVNIKELVWRIGDGEGYTIENDALSKPLFPTNPILSGEVLFRKISEDDYYVIFADLKGFLQEADVREITTYEAFVESECQVVLLIVDSSYVYFYAKDQDMIKTVHAKAIAAGYDKVTYITEANDELETWIAF